MKAASLGSVIAIALLPAFAPSIQTAAAASGSPDVILGRWKGTDTPTHCPITAFDIGRDVLAQTQYGASRTWQVLGIDLQGGKPDEVTVTTGGGIQPFHIVDRDHIELHTPYAQCPYVREG